MPHPNGISTFDELRSMPDDELYQKIDQQFSLGSAPHHSMLAQLYRDELVRREQDRSTQAMLDYTERIYRFTKQVRDMTLVVLFAAILSLAASVVSFMDQPEQAGWLNSPVRQACSVPPD